ncbi:uncharacterized protein DUF3302 [Shimia isoporae]|uniref:Uncharacterized protein DUF3302 n=1 Tax=Shimia isoporae TaxID=647720 RepID=A0A4R1N027_9RHOB|nr:DUF3302 domain-containing protein [Shimia isoporae]TCK98906.1 uncharacterized protein DUF3302 [Shimia isoporae]
MSGLDIFAWIVLIVLVVTAIAVFITLAMLPGKIAAQRQHPYDEAINVAGWLGAFLGGVLWPIALIWAFTHKPSEEAAEGDNPTGKEAQS